MVGGGGAGALGGSGHYAGSGGASSITKSATSYTANGATGHNVSNGGSGGGNWTDTALRNGASDGGSSYGAGQGTTTRAFGVAGAALYAGGGGGSGATIAGIGGAGGGGNGRTTGGNAYPGTPNTGGGGGGCGVGTNQGGAGGSGIVIVRFPIGSLTATGGVISDDSTYVYRTFTSNGNFIITSLPSTSSYYLSFYWQDYLGNQTLIGDSNIMATTTIILQMPTTTAITFAGTPKDYAFATTTHINGLEIIGTSSPMASSSGFTFDFIINIPFLHFLMVVLIIAICIPCFYFAAKSIWD